MTRVVTAVVMTGMGITMIMTCVRIVPTAEAVPVGAAGCEKVGMGAGARDTARLLLRGFASGVLVALVFVHLFLELYEGTHSGLKFNWKPLCTVCAGCWVGMMLMIFLPGHHGAA
eukprot:gene41646-57617_t